MTDYLTFKGYGRIYVLTQEDVQKVENVIKEMDSYEFDNYYPEGLVTTLDNYPRVVYIGKFDFSFSLTEECKKRSIPIFIFDSGFEDRPRGYYNTEPYTKDQIQTLMA